MKNITKLATFVALAFGFNATAGAATAGAATEGVDYTVVNAPIPALKNESNHVEVLEFFAYWCPHCYDLDPIILKHSKTFTDDTYLRTEHVVWDAERDEGFARVAAAVNQSGLKYQANPAIFDAVVKNRINLGKPEIFTKWATEQSAFDGKKLLEAYNSFSAKTQAKKMADWTNQYNIQGTPTVFVGGKYQVIFKDGFEAGMKTVDELVEKVRQERGIKAAKHDSSKVNEKVSQSAKPVRSLAASLVQQANK